MRELHALNGVGHLVASVIDAADNSDTCQPLRQPLTDGLCVFSLYCNNHATAHVEGTVHLPGFNTACSLQPVKFWVRLKRSVNVPAKTVVQTEEVR